MSPTTSGPPEGRSWRYDHYFLGGRLPESSSWDAENYPEPPNYDPNTGTVRGRWMASPTHRGERALWERQARASGMPPSPYPHPHPQATVTAYSRKQTNHLLHLALSFVTCGAWLLVWPCVWAWNKFGPRNRTVYQ